MSWKEIRKTWPVYGRAVGFCRSTGFDTISFSPQELNTDSVIHVVPQILTWPLKMGMSETPSSVTLEGSVAPLISAKVAAENQKEKTREK